MPTGSRKRSTISSVTGPRCHRKNPSGGSDAVDSCSLWQYNSWVSVLQWLSPRQSVRLTYFFTCLRRIHPPTTALPAAIGFPIVILLLIPLRTAIVPKLPFTEEELAVLDGPTASPFVSLTFNLDRPIQSCSRPHQTMESVGGTF